LNIILNVIKQLHIATLAASLFAPLTETVLLEAAVQAPLGSELACITVLSTRYGSLAASNHWNDAP